MIELQQLRKSLRMQTWSDSFLSGFQFWAGWVAIIGTTFGLLSAIATLYARKEASARQSAKDTARNSRLEAAEQELSNTRQELMEARSAIEVAKSIAMVAESKTKPRRLTVSQKALIINSLTSTTQKSKIFVVASFFDKESMAFAGDIAGVLRDSDFDVSFNEELGPDTVITVGPPGLHIVLKDTSVPNQVAWHIQQSFKKAGIALLGTHSNDKDFPPDRIEIAVGQK